jgi:hypothetical protein
LFAPTTLKSFGSSGDVRLNATLALPKITPEASNPSAITSRFPPVLNLKENVQSVSLIVASPRGKVFPAKGLRRLILVTSPDNLPLN